MKIAAYCRVSTDKQDQLNSLETQKKFFSEYTERTGDTLVRLYADEGISGTKVKNRREFLRMMADAEKGMFELVVVKDISRFARNTVDLLQNIRKLKSLGIETQFLTANMTSMGNSEFVLTIFGALAQEESANTSKRVKFGKRLNAEKGRVPNLVFGYDKTAGDLFHLAVNETEAALVKKIFEMYVGEGCGAAKIANWLNAQRAVTKRGCAWSPNAVVRILTNELYTGKIINGKQEVKDFLTGRREKRNSAEWIVTENPQLQIVEADLFADAQNMMRERGERFKVGRERRSNRYLFSTLIKCKSCGMSFRRVERTEGKRGAVWVCPGRYGRGVDSCPNRTTIGEKELLGAFTEAFSNILACEKNARELFCEKMGERLRESGEESSERQLNVELGKIRRARKKYLEMYAEYLLSREELEKGLEDEKRKAAEIESRLSALRIRRVGREKYEELLLEKFPSLTEIADASRLTNTALRRVIAKIEADASGNVSIYFRETLQDAD